MNSSLIKPKVRLQYDRVRPGGTAPTVLMMKQWTKDKFHRIRVTAHCTQHDPEMNIYNDLLQIFKEGKVVQILRLGA